MVYVKANGVDAQGVAHEGLQHCVGPQAVLWRGGGVNVEPVEEDVLLLQIIVERVVLRGLYLQIYCGQERGEALDVRGAVASHQSAEGVGYVAEALQDGWRVHISGGQEAHVACVEGKSCGVVVTHGAQCEHFGAEGPLRGGDGPVAEGEIQLVAALEVGLYL